ncbi:YTH domain-containing protein 1 [Pseudocercospora fuligena]|uniref:YTH domain-containing protein 1 n=1 Tax=Pseudocercospora fuligena TaxID=685502 RepID=A0A8H6RLM1_9PEZI|nr:YTH domain-containing protein 1 [Pseudocercospora fuligena]
MEGYDLMALFGLNTAQQANGEDEVDDNDDDFYNDHSAPNGDAQAGATNDQTVDAQAHKLAEERKAENQRQAELLRAKLIARRQNTPAKQTNTSRQNTPSKTIAPPAKQQQGSSVNMSSDPPEPPATHSKKEVEQPTAVSSLEALLAEGKAYADAKTAALAAKPDPADVNTTNTKESEQQVNGINANVNGVTAQESIKAEQPPTPETSRPTQQRRPTNLSDSYYVDLPAWLELTGYHDVDFRNNKLRTYKERRTLEEEAARIAERLEKLRQIEQQEMQQMRISTPMPAVNMAPPPLPSAMPSATNGIKRARSPEATPTTKNARRREDNGGFRIRGATEATDNRQSRRLSRSPPALDRRTAYPDSRRRSIDERSERSRDPSLERRQSYYRRDGEPLREPPPRYDHYVPREPPPRSGYHASPGASRHPSQKYRGSAALELRKGGVRYFMIKSWNHENVKAAQREGVWATQEKNEQLLTEAFKTSRHVLLLFSVNKSMAFQGYALMTSPPDPKLPKPAWAAKLNWGTSATFTLRWLGTASIPFRTVGHLKNTLNINEDGEPLAVLVGKDGQEISTDAGQGVVWVLDEAEANAKDGDRGGR